MFLPFDLFEGVFPADFLPSRKGTTLQTARTLLAASVMIATSLNSRGQTSATTVPSVDTSHGPIADSTQYLGNTTKDRSRQLENNNNPSGVEIRELPQGLQRLPEDWDTVGETKALPVSAADAIFIGNVTKDTALFSTDHTSLFSTFNVTVSRVFLNRLSEAVQVGTPAEVERYGARVRYPDGKIESVNVEGRNYPQVGSRYIFFVEQTPKKERWTKGNAEALNIITAYEVRGGKVYALDRMQNAGALPYEKYDGMAEAEFLALLSKRIQQAALSAPAGGAL